MCGSVERCKWRAIGINNQWKNGLCCMYFCFRLKFLMGILWVGYQNKQTVRSNGLLNLQINTKKQNYTSCKNAPWNLLWKQRHFECSFKVVWLTDGGRGCIRELPATKCSHIFKELIQLNLPQGLHIQMLKVQSTICLLQKQYSSPFRGFFDTFHFL